MVYRLYRIIVKSLETTPDRVDIILIMCYYIYLQTVTFERKKDIAKIREEKRFEEADRI